MFNAVGNIVDCSHRVLRLSSGIDVIGPVMWDLSLCLLLAWIIAFLCMVKGIKTTGKVMYNCLRVVVLYIKCYFFCINLLLRGLWCDV